MSAASATACQDPASCETAADTPHPSRLRSHQARLRGHFAPLYVGRESGRLSRPAGAAGLGLNATRTRRNAPPRRVIGTMAACHSPNHIPLTHSSRRNAPRLPDRSRRRQERAEQYCAARDAGSDPPKTCGSAAQWVFANHTHRGGSLPQIGPSRKGVGVAVFCVRPRGRRDRSRAAATAGPMGLCPASNPSICAWIPGGSI